VRPVELEPLPALDELPDPEDPEPDELPDDPPALEELPELPEPEEPVRPDEYPRPFTTFARGVSTDASPEPRTITMGRPGYQPPRPYP
jgi:hypothetical protein